MAGASPFKPTETTAATRDVRHFEYIDALRGMAFLGVLVVHIFHSLIWWGHMSPPLAGWIDTLAGSGRTGVQLFFVISALTLVMSVRSRTRNERFPTQNFFIRRVARIAPLFWAAILLYACVNQNRYFLQSGQAPEGMHWWHVLMTVAMVHGWYPTTFNSVVPGDWSVGVEMSFYLLVPALAALLTTWRRTVAVTIAACLTGLGVTTLLDHFIGPLWTGAYRAPFQIFSAYWLPMELPVFLMGFLLYFLLKRDDARAVSVAQAKTISLIRIGGAAAIFVLTVYGADRLHVPEDWLYGAAFFLFAWGLALHPWPLIVNPAVRYIGTVSYSCYLCHFFVVYVIVQTLARHVVGRIHHSFSTALFLAVAYIVALGFTVAMATLTYRFIEQPGIALGKRLIARNEARPVPASR